MRKRSTVDFALTAWGFISCAALPLFGLLKADAEDAPRQAAATTGTVTLAATAALTISGSILESTNGTASLAISGNITDISNGTTGTSQVQVIPALTLTPAKAAGETKEECEKKEQDAAQNMVRAAQEAYEKEKREMQERLNKDAAWQPSYEQSGVIKVSKLAPDRDIDSFCLNKDGNLLVCCGAKSKSIIGMMLGGKSPNGKGGIFTFSPEGKLLGEWKLPIEPQAICLGKDGLIYAAGSGRLLKLDQTGKILLEADAPNVADMPSAPKIEVKPKLEGPEAKAAEEARQKEIAEVQKELRTASEEYQKVVQEAAKSLKPNDDASMAELQSKVAEPMAKLQSLQARLSELTTTPEMRIAQMKAQRERMATIAGMAITDKDLFFSCTAAKGYGYVVWRVDHEFAHPKRIVENLGGCCGQMDIQAHDGELWVAHNGRHKVERYTRDGKKTLSFGRTDRIAADGFGGCCEPKNLRFGPDNMIFACESGPPTCVKQFDITGKFLGVAVVAPWSSGCVRVTTEYDAQKDRFFVLNAGDKNIHTFKKKAVQNEKKVAKSDIGPTFQQVGKGDKADFEKYDIGEPESAPPPELDVNPALEKPAK